MNLYHVTFYRNLPKIAVQGLRPGGPGSMGRGGGYDTHSKGKVFLTTFSGLRFWHMRAEEHASNMADDLLGEGVIPVVLRVPEMAAEDDPLGNRDSVSGKSLMTTEAIPANLIEIYSGSRWVPVRSYASVDPKAALDYFEWDGGYWEFKSDSPLLPKHESIRTADTIRQLLELRNREQ